MIQLKPKANWRVLPGVTMGGNDKWYKWGDLQVCVGDPEVEGSHHLSISHRYRYPTWDEIYQARYDLLPDDVTFAIFLPRKSQYVNIHPNCFHLYEVKDQEIPGGIIGI